MKVNVLMSTYNGEKFLAQQIESIQAQTYQDWQLLIRDDGSTDGTRQIIQQFVVQDARIKWLNPDETKNLGVVKSFYELVKAAQADVYFFSDQDDVWLPEKIAQSLAETNKHDQSQPLMVYMDLKVVDQDLNILQESMIKSQSGHANTQLVQELIENTVTGGVAMINHALAEKWQTTAHLLMHDWYLALLASATGQLVFMDQPGELYRQHETNVLGARTQDKRFKILSEGPKTIYQRYWRHIHELQAQAQQVLSVVGQELSAEQRQLLSDFITLDQPPFFERLRRLVRHGYKKNKPFHSLVFWSLILTKLYHTKSQELL